MYSLSVSTACRLVNTGTGAPKDSGVAGSMVIIYCIDKLCEGAVFSGTGTRGYLCRYLRFAGRRKFTKYVYADLVCLEVSWQPGSHCDWDRG